MYAFHPIFYWKIYKTIQMKNSELKEFIYDIIEHEYPLESFNTKEEYISIIDELNDIKNEINDSLLYRVKEELAEEEPETNWDLLTNKLSTIISKQIDKYLDYVDENCEGCYDYCQYDIDDDY